MAEEADGQDTGAEALGAGVDPAAVALSLSGASRETADAFLDDQRSLIADQRHHLHRQFTALDLNIWQQRLGVLLRIATGFVGLIVAAGLILMIWDAAHANGLVIEEFSVPPDLASRGITGQVVANQMLDNLTTIQNETVAFNEGPSLTSGSGDTINVQIPDTGISLGEVYRFLRRWLGHEIHLSGEVYRTATGIAITARISGDSGATFTGSEADLNSLVQKAAENIYGRTQPKRYADYLREHDRLADSVAIAQGLAKSGDKDQSAMGYSSWGTTAGALEGIDPANRILERGIASGSSYPTLWVTLARDRAARGWPEMSRDTFQKALSLVSSHGDEFYEPAQTPLAKEFLQALIDDDTGDFKDASLALANALKGKLVGFSGVTAYLAEAELGEHELSVARSAMADPAITGVNPMLAARLNITVVIRIEDEAQDWAGVLSEADAYLPTLRKYPGLRTYWPTETVPYIVHAEARLGKIADAEAQIAATPGDCYDCLIARARIAEVEGQHGRADYWFAQAIDGQKSIPFAYAYWGQALLDRGDLDGAIAKFAIANQKGPKFSDPLEMWGEALMKKNRSDLALAKFEEAEKYAPNWGRLHLKWGEALGYAGPKDEAKKQFALAAGLDLSSADKAELARVSGPDIKP